MFDNDEMFVIKRNGERAIVSFDKILKRIKNTGQDAGIHQLNYTALTMKVIDQLYDGISTTQIDELTAEQCASLASTHPDYTTLAGCIVVSNLQKNTSPLFSRVMSDLYHFKDTHGEHCPIVSNNMFEVVTKYGDELDAICDYQRDYLIDYFGFKTLERAYLLKINKKIVERPQHMWLRVAIGIHCDNMDRIKETYDAMSNKYFTHATPTLFNAGTPRPQLSSCFLLAMEEDSINGIYNTLKDCANISKWAGGIGLHIHNIRATGTHIRGTNGTSNGIVPMLRVFNNTAKYVDQCIVPETVIYTTHGPKQIQHCEAGETQILNAMGQMETIEKVLTHFYEGPMLSIHTLHSIYPLSITPTHPIYAIANQKKGLNFSMIKNRLDKNLAHMEYIEAKDVDENTMIAYPVPEYEKDSTKVNEDDCYFYGIMLGDGCMYSTHTNYGYVSMHSIKKNHLKDFLITYFEKRCIEYFVVEEGNTTRISWNMNIQLPFQYYDLYDENKEKRILPKWMHLPICKIKRIIKGLLETDGCNSKKELVFDSTSYALIEGLRYLCLRLGILTSGVERNRIGQHHVSCYGSDIIHTKLNYVLRIPRTREICEILHCQYDENQFFKFFRYQKYLFTRVQKIEQNEYSGTVYDLQMSKEHSYVIHNGIVHNGGGKRNGSFAIYLEPWHGDVEMFLQMRKNHGDEELKARDLFYALWIPDLFMDRVKTDAEWTLMCPDECPGLSDVFGEEFQTLYETYEKEGRGKKTMKARKLWFQILDAQMETGTPYLCYKDAANRKTNQKNIGIIKSSNLCTEIMEVSTKNETAVCNLASIALPAFVNLKTNPPTFEFDKLHAIVKIVTYNLNKVIDVNYYPTEKTQTSNRKHRPIGIGVQGLADTFIQMGFIFDSDEAKELNRHIFETIYHAALTLSCELAEERCLLLEPLHLYDDFSERMSIEDHVTLQGHLHSDEMPLLHTQYRGAYSSFPGSPASEGILQFDMWNIEPSQDRYDWVDLKKKIQQYGLRNSLLLAPMPTASTSQILGYNECIEPITSNIYSRRTLAGEFIMTNKYLMKELFDLGLWNEEIKNNIIANHGSVQHIEIIPLEIRAKYKTVWEIPMRCLIDMAADRGAYICQSQSLNLWMEDPTYATLTSMHFYAWSKGLKTGIYYLRRRGRHQAQQFTIEPDKQTQNQGLEEDEICEMCSA
jgi:ribonucleotide reductase alpha subunit